jgi:hypothetical protein
VNATRLARIQDAALVRATVMRFGALWLPVLAGVGCAGTSAQDPELAASRGGSETRATHSRAFFEEVKRTDKLPDGVRASQLLVEIEPWLASPDPALRDELASTLCARWIRGGLLSDDELHAALARFSHDLDVGIGQKGTDSVVLRSFSALALDAIAARDLERPFLGEEGCHALVSTALAYLAREKDLRGWDERVGWMHATAHTADLLRRLARNPSLCETDQDAIVVGLEDKLSRVDSVFTHGENRRLAQVLVALLGRTDCHVATIEAWFGRVRARNDALWSGDALDPHLYARVENETQLFHELLAAMWSMPPDNVSAARVREVLLATR